MQKINAASAGYLILILFLFFSRSTIAKNAISKDSASKNAVSKDSISAPQKGDIYFSPIPALAVNPTFGFMYGVGASTSAYLGTPDNTKLSNAFLTLTYSTKKQFMFTLKSFLFSENNDYMFIGDWRYFDSSQATFGLGTGPQSAKLVGTGFEYNDNAFSKPILDEQLMSFRLLRFYESVLKKVSNNLYVGLGYHLDIHSEVQDNITDLTSTPPSISSYYAYNEKYGFDQSGSVLSGVSLNVIYDSRDNINNPYKGRYAYASFKMNPQFLGSTKSSSSLWLEYRDYFNFTPDHHNIFAVWSYANISTSGVLPYMDLPALGWDQYGNSGRGYTQGRFRGQSLIYTEFEYRKHLLGTKKNPDFMGMVIFSNFTTASSTDNNISLFKYINPGYGAGLRFMLNKNARSNLTIDYGMGSYGAKGVYIMLNEKF